MQNVFYTHTRANIFIRWFLPFLFRILANINHNKTSTSKLQSECQAVFVLFIFLMNFMRLRGEVWSFCTTSECEYCLVSNCGNRSYELHKGTLFAHIYTTILATTVNKHMKWYMKCKGKTLSPFIWMYTFCIWRRLCRMVLVMAINSWLLLQVYNVICGINAIFQCTYAFNLNILMYPITHRWDEMRCSYMETILECWFLALFDNEPGKHYPKRV